jgi:hypothetical protein
MRLQKPGKRLDFFVVALDSGKEVGRIFRFEKSWGGGSTFSCGMAKGLIRFSSRRARMRWPRLGPRGTCSNLKRDCPITRPRPAVCWSWLEQLLDFANPVESTPRRVLQLVPRGDE